MRRKDLISGLLGLVLLLTALSASALESVYSSSFVPSVPVTLSAGQDIVLNFATTPGYFTSAFLDIYVTALADSARITRGRTYVSPPSGEVALDALGRYLFTSDFHQGLNRLSLNNYLTDLNLSNSNSSLALNLYMDRGSITLNNATLTGTVAPEPLSMALVGAGLVGLPFVRRLRNCFK